MRSWTRMLAVATVALASISGCQTYFPEAGLTLPSPHYLRHPPQYIPPSPQFPLSRELANLEEAAAQQAAGARPGMQGP